MKIKDFIEKLRNYPDNRKKIIAFSIIGVLALVMLAFWFPSFLKRMDTLSKTLPDTLKLPSVNTETTQNDGTKDWIVKQDLGFQLKYPENFFEIGHEPNIINGTIVKIALPKNREEIVINDIDYYHWHTEDAAAGHTYFYDLYQPLTSNILNIFIQLDTLEVNCQNYLPLEENNTEQAKNYQECVSKNEARPNILQQIVSTFKLMENK